MALSIWRYNSSQLSLSQERMCAASDSLSMHMAQRRVIIRRDSITPSVKLCSRQKHITRKKTRSNEKHRQTPKALSQVVGGGGAESGQFCPQPTQRIVSLQSARRLQFELLFRPGYVRAAPAEWKGRGQRRRSGYRSLTSCPALHTPWRNKVKFSKRSLYHMKGSTRAFGDRIPRRRHPMSHITPKISPAPRQTGKESGGGQVGLF